MKAAGNGRPVFISRKTGEPATILFKGEKAAAAMANFTRNQAETLPKSGKMPESLKKRPHKMPCIAFSEGGLIVYTCQKAATLQRNAGSARKPGNVPFHPAGGKQ